MNFLPLSCRGKKIPKRNNQSPTEKMDGTHTEGRFGPKSYSRGKNGRGQVERKTSKDAKGMDDEGWLQQA